jgi:hypothetical protein
MEGARKPTSEEFDPITVTADGNVIWKRYDGGMPVVTRPASPVIESAQRDPAARLEPIQSEQTNMSDSEAMSEISEKKALFHEDALMFNAVKDSLGSTRNGRAVYAKGVKHDDAFKDVLISELRGLARKYFGQNVLDEPHYENIRGIISRLEQDHGAVLNEGVLKYGFVAKAVNVYLKHLWCGKPDLDVRPTHCPFDDNIIRELGLGSEFEHRWTFASEKDYREWVRLAYIAAQADGGLTLSEWELKKWKP